MQYSKWALLGILNLLTAHLHAEMQCAFKGKAIRTSDSEAISKVTGSVRCSYRDETSIGIEYVYDRGLLKRVRDFYRPAGKLKSDYGILNPSESPYSTHNRDGVCKEWSEDGVLRLKEIYEQGRLITSHRYNESGSLTSLEMFGQSDSERKTRIEFTPQGKIESLYCGTAFSGAKYRKLCGFDGLSKVALHSKEGKVEAFRTFLNGQLVETAEIDGETGKTRSSDKKALEGVEGVKSEFYSNGKIKQEKRYNSEKLYHGAQKEYSEEGTLVRHALFEKGFMVEERIYYQNSQTKSHMKRVQDERGIAVDSKQYWDDGKPMFEGAYRESRRQTYSWPGHYRAYDDLEPFGKHTHWYPSGQVEKECYWDRGKRVGVWKSYDRTTGSLLSESFYESDVLVRLRTFVDGQLRSDETLFPDGSRKSKSKPIER